MSKLFLVLLLVSFVFGIQETDNIIFLSENEVQGGEGVEAFDALCQQEADEHGLEGRFRALVGTADRPAYMYVNPKALYYTPVVTATMDGAFTVGQRETLNDGHDLFSTTELDVPIRVQANGVAVHWDHDRNRVWTGFNAVTGEADGVNCANWSTYSKFHALGAVGSITHRNEKWGLRGTAVCSAKRRLYCAAESYMAFVSDARPKGADNFDQICQNEADAAGFAGTYHAFVSGSEREVRDFVDRSAVYRNAVGEVISPLGVFTKNSGKFRNSVKTENLGVRANGASVIDAVWTGTDEEADVATYLGVQQHCNDWSSSVGTVTGRHGKSGRADDTWISDSTAGRQCSWRARLYCFQDSLNPYLAFVSTGRIQGTKGIAAMDAMCQAEACANGLKGSFRALISGWEMKNGVNETRPATKYIEDDGKPYRNMNGQFIARGTSGIFVGNTVDSFNYPVTYTAEGHAVDNDDRVWTGTENDGSIDQYRCDNWEMTEGEDNQYLSKGRTGKPTQSNHRFSDNANTPCEEKHRVYCFSEDPDASNMCIPAFPGAEGEGASARGGRGGEVIHVLNLNDDGPGSLREAVAQIGPRTIVFDVSGTISLVKPLNIEHGQVTIAGQTAPEGEDSSNGCTVDEAGGITLKGYGFLVNADDVVIRFIRFRLGDDIWLAYDDDGDDTEGNRDNQREDAINIQSGRRIIVDHCSAGLTTDEGISVSGILNDDDDEDEIDYLKDNYDTTYPKLDKVTVQWSIIAYSLDVVKLLDCDKAHAYGSLIDGAYGARFSFHHNLYAHHRNRNPKTGSNVNIENESNPANDLNDPNSLYSQDEGFTFDFRNNVIYNFGSNAAGYNADDVGLVYMNYMNNAIIAGPATDGTFAFREQTDSSDHESHFSGNVKATSQSGGLYNFVTPSNQYGMIKFDEGKHSSYEQSAPFEAAFVVTGPATHEYNRVLATAGAVYPQRDMLDRVAVKSVMNKNRGPCVDFTENWICNSCSASGAPSPCLNCQSNSNSDYCDQTDNGGLMDYAESASDYDIPLYPDGVSGLEYGGVSCSSTSSPCNDGDGDGLPGTQNVNGADFLYNGFTELEKHMNDMVEIFYKTASSSVPCTQCGQ